MSAAERAADAADAELADAGIRLDRCTVYKAVYYFLSAFRGRFWLEWAAGFIARAVLEAMEIECGEDPGLRGVPEHMRP